MKIKVRRQILQLYNLHIMSTVRSESDVCCLLMLELPPIHDWKAIYELSFQDTIRFQDVYQGRTNKKLYLTKHVSWFQYSDDGHGPRGLWMVKN